MEKVKFMEGFKSQAHFLGSSSGAFAVSLVLRASCRVRDVGHQGSRTPSPGLCLLEFPRS